MADILVLVYSHCMFDIISCPRRALNVCLNVLNTWSSREKVKSEKGKIFGYISDSLNYNRQDGRPLIRFFFNRTFHLVICLKC